MLVVCDFDQSAATVNGAQLVLKELGSSLETAHKAFLDGELPFRKYQEICFDSIEAPLERISEVAAQAIALRPGFPEAVDAANAVGARFIVASAGLEAYIRPVLTVSDLGDVPVVAVSVTTDASTKRIIEYDYPEAESWCDSNWAVCKCRPMREALSEGEEVVFIGDGLRSDTCAAQRATTVFARHRLLKFCRENNIAAIPYEDFHVIAEYIQSKAPVSSR